MKTFWVSRKKLVLVCFAGLFWAAVLTLPALGDSAGVVLTTLHSFQDFPNGAAPGGLVRGIDGYFYGMTASGGTNGGWGSIYKISASGSLTSLYSFSGTNDGYYPMGGLVRGTDGYFYGTTYFGGTNDFGTVFKIGANGAFTNLYSFGSVQDDYGHPLDGLQPQAALVQGADGNFYGMTEYGGTYGAGNVFKISANGGFTNLYSFDGAIDGGYPRGGLVQGSDGYLYGTTENGGIVNPDFEGPGIGTVFKISTNGVLSFSVEGGPGAYPIAGLVQGSDGNFYGTTEGGGTNNGDYGTVFKITTNGALTSLYSFTCCNNETGPIAGLVQGSDGSFYGATPGSGVSGDFGTVFRITTNGALTRLYSFTGGKDGGRPQDGLVQGSDGSFYSTTETGGQGGGGTIFRLTVVPEIQAVTLTNGTLCLTWITEAGGKYELQYNSDLNLTNWINLGNPTVATGSTLNITDSVTNALRRFYRVALLQ